MANMVIVQGNGSVQRNVTEATLLDAYRAGESLIWIDFERPAPAREAHRLISELGLDESAVEHLTQLHRGARAVRFHDHLLIVLYDVTLSTDSADLGQHEVVLIVGERYLVSVHGNADATISRAAACLEPSLERFGVGIGAVVFPILETLANSYLQLVDEVRDQVNALEDRVLNQEESDGVTELYRLRRRLSGLRRVIAPELSLIGGHSAPAPFAIDPAMQDAMQDIRHDMQHAVEEIDLNLNMLPDMLATFEALKADNLNRIVKLLTVWSIILTAVALFPTVMGISLAQEPSVSPYIGYFVAAAAMVLVGGAIWYVFKRSGWTD